MRVFAKGTLRAFWQRHPEAEEGLQGWWKTALRATWRNPAEVRMRYADASILRNNRVVFRVKGNAYRLVVRIDYGNGLVFIRFVGTHAEYDHINAEEV